MINTLNTKQDSLLDIPPRFSGALDSAASNNKVTAQLRDEPNAIMQKIPEQNSPEELTQADKTIKPDESKDNYIEAFINNKMVRKVFPDIMNWLNISGNAFSLASSVLGFAEAPKKFAQTIGALSTKSFLIATAVINIVERIYAKNFLSALGYFNDILVASFVGQDHMYLARGTASGTYNMANALSIANNKFKFANIEDHLKHLGVGYKKFFANLFSPNVISNFLNSKNAMFAIFGGMFANLGALTWIFSGQDKLATTVRDIAGVVMDVEQLNPGHLKSGYKNYFWSGVTLAIGTMCDWLAKIIPGSKNVFVPLTFIIDGVGRHLLRLHQNQKEIEDHQKKANPVIQPQIRPVAKVELEQKQVSAKNEKIHARNQMESLVQVAA